MGRWATQGPHQTADASRGLRWPAGQRAGLPLLHMLLAEDTQGVFPERPGRPETATLTYLEGRARRRLSVEPYKAASLANSPAIPGSSVLTAHILRKCPTVWRVRAAHFFIPRTVDSATVRWSLSLSVGAGHRRRGYLEWVPRLF